MNIAIRHRQQSLRGDQFDHDMAFNGDVSLADARELTRGLGAFARAIAEEGGLIDEHIEELARAVIAGQVPEPRKLRELTRAALDCMAPHWRGGSDAAKALRLLAWLGDGLDHPWQTLAAVGAAVEWFGRERVAVALAGPPSLH